MKYVQPTDIVSLANAQFKGHDLQETMLNIATGNTDLVTFDQSERLAKFGYVVMNGKLAQVDYLTEGLMSAEKLLISEKSPIVKWILELYEGKVSGDGYVLAIDDDEFCTAFVNHYGLFLNDGEVYTPDYRKLSSREIQAMVRKHLDVLTIHPDAKKKLSSIRKHIAQNIPAFATVKQREIVEAESFADVEEETPDFLIRPYFPIGKITIVQADPGVGKTTFVCAIGANASRGGEVCGIPTKPVNCLFLSTEDDASDLRGRIENAGGDLSRCYFISAKNCAGLSLVSPRIEQLVKEKEIGLIVFDPLQQFLGGIDMFRANETRPILSELAAMAKRNGCAAVLISHMAKAQGKGLYKALGSIDIVGAARSVLYVVRDPDKPEDAQENIVMHIKSSAAKAGQSIRYRIVDRNGHACVNWLGLAKYTERDYQKALVAQERGRKDSNAYEESDLVPLVRQIIKDNPNGLFITYDELTNCAVEVLGRFIASGSKYKPMFDAIAPELLKRDHIRITFPDDSRRMKDYHLQGKTMTVSKTKKARGVNIMPMIAPGVIQTTIQDEE